MTEKIITSACRQCSAGCGVLIHVEDDKIVKIEGNPECLRNQGEICARAVLAKEVVHAPDRLLHPLKRVGRRGEGKWEQISWDEALDTIAERLNKIKEKYGAKSYVHLYGQQWHWNIGALINSRFCFAFGSPNASMHSDHCAGPLRLTELLTFGPPHALVSVLPGTLDYDDWPTKCMVFWGANPFTSRSNRTRKILDAKERGAKIIVPDPYFSSTAQKADLWLQLKPGTDVPLAMAMINVIIKEGLYDKDFVEKWTYGFDRLAKHVQDYTPEKAEKITWVPREMIEKAARMYATNKPGQIEQYIGIMGTFNAIAAHRALSILQAIVGNFDVRGGYGWPPELPHMKNMVKNMLGTPELCAQSLSVAKYPLISMYDKQHGVPIPCMTCQVTDGILYGSPYPIKAMMVVGANPPSTAGPNRKDWDEALSDENKLEFLAVMDLFMTATAKFADIILPAAWWPEKVDLAEYHLCSGYFSLREAVKPQGECRSEIPVLMELAKKMGLGEYFPWKNEEEIIDELFKPLSVAELKKNPSGMWVPGCKWPDDIKYKKYETNGFKTPSGKCELYSQILEQHGEDPLPVYHDYTEALSQETGLSVADLEAEYPLYLSKHNTYVYAHSQFRSVWAHRQLEPGPVLEIHPATAERLNIKNGDKVLIESPAGAISNVRAELTERAHPRVVFMLHGWSEEADTWYLHGKTRQPVLGTTPNREIRVRVRRA